MLLLNLDYLVFGQISIFFHPDFLASNIFKVYLRPIKRKKVICIS